MEKIQKDKKMFIMLFARFYNQHSNFYDLINDVTNQLKSIWDIIFFKAIAFKVSIPKHQNPIYFWYKQEIFTVLLSNSPKRLPRFSPGYEDTENMFYLFK